MEKTVVLILNKGDFPFYLRDLCTLLTSKHTIHLFRYHIPQVKTGNSSSGDKFFSNFQPFSAAETQEFLPESDIIPSVDKDPLIINLSDQQFQSPAAEKQRLIYAAFLNNLFGAYSPDLVNAFIKNDNTFSTSVIYTEASGSNYQINEGRYLLLKYNYSATLKLVISGIIQLLSESISRLERGRMGKSLPLHTFTLNAAEYPLSALKKKIKKELLQHRIQQLFYTYKWNIGIIEAPIHEVALQQGQHWKVKWLKEEAGDDFNADPFGIFKKDGPELIYEHYSQGKGILRLNTKGSPDKEILSASHHFSYPYLFHEGQSIYCLPEQQSIGQVILYTFHADKKSLEKYCILLDNFNAVDPSLLYYNNKYWLFCTNAANKGADLRLYIFYADNLCGPYRPHLQNPVKTDIRSARPGGHFFTHEGTLYRPSQDSSNSYGGRLVIHQIEELTETTFTERAINFLEPDQLQGKYTAGWHTLSSCGNFTLVDGKRKRFNPRNLLKIFRKK